MELARTHAPGDTDRRTFDAVAAWLLMGMMLLVGALIPAGTAQAAPSIYCPSLSLTVAYGGAVTETVGYCDGGTTIGVGPLKVAPQYGDVSFSPFADAVTYTHRGAGAATTDQFVIDDSTGGDITITVTIQPPTSAITITPGSLTGLKVGASYSQQFSAAGGDGAYTYAVTSGSIPGLTLSSSGLLSGTPSSRATSSMSVQVTDGTGAMASQTYSVTPDSPTITVDPLPAAGQGVAYSRTLSASGGIAPYQISYASGALPPGLSMTGAVLSGTPTANGNYSFQVQVQDSSGGTFPYSVVLPASVNVVPPPTIVVSPAALNTMTAAAAFDQTLTASGGTAAYTFALASGVLPRGLTLDSTGRLHGTPNATGFYNFTVRATDANAFTGQRTYTVLINDPTIVFNTATLPPATQNQTYSGSVDPASGGIAPYSYSTPFGGLPPGITLGSTNGAFAGTPTTTGTYTFTVRATDSTGGAGPYSAEADFTITVAAGVPQPNNSSFNATYGSGATQVPLLISGGAPTSVAVVTGPAHGTATANGLSITYAPASGYAGPDSFTYTATNAAGTSSAATVSVTVSNPIFSLTVSGLSGVKVGVAATIVATFSGGAEPFTGLAVTPLPAGLSVTGTTARSITVTGTPTAAGNFNLMVSGTDSSTGNGPFTSSMAVPLTVASATLAFIVPSGQVTATYGQRMDLEFAASGGIAPYAYSITGALPAGVTVDGAWLRGVPTTAGSYPFTVTATDSSTGAGAPATASASYTLQIGAPTVVVGPALAPPASVGADYAAQFTATGGIEPYTFAVTTGALPTGVTLQPDGSTTGAPIASGAFNFTITATDANGQTGSRSYGLTVSVPALSLAPGAGALAVATLGTAYQQAFSASGGLQPYTYTIVSGTVPTGLSLAADGTLSGTPTAAGTSVFSVRAVDSTAGTAAELTQSYTLQVNESVPVAVDDTATTTAQQAVTIDVDANDNGVITSLAIVQMPAHGTATVSGLDVVYTPATGYAGTDVLRYTVTGPGGTSQPATVSITVVALPVPVVVDQAVTVLAGSAVRIDATAGASGGPFTAVTVLEQPAEGTVTVEGTSVVYTAPATATGTALLRYTLGNAFGASAPATVTITVNPLPQAQAQQRDVIAGGSVQVDLTAGATGGPFTAAKVMALTPSSAGEVRVEQSGAAWLLTFTPAAAYAGVATVGFTLDNRYATSAQALVTFNVAPRSDPSKDAEVLGMLDAQAATTRRFATAQIGNFQQRLERLHGAGQGGSDFQNGLGFQVGRNCEPGRGVANGDPCRSPDLGDDAAGYGEALPYTRDTANRSLGLWTGGMISSGAADSRVGREGLDFETSGVSAGADYRMSPTFALGAGVGYGQDRTDVGNNGTRSDGDAYTMAVYASWHPGRHLFVDWLVGYQLLGFENRRYVTDTGGSVQGKRDGTQWFGSVSAGADFQKDQWQLSPYARLDAARARLDGYTEAGADSAYALAYQRQDVDTTTLSAGLRASFAHSVSWGRLSPQLRLEYQRELEDPSAAGMQYADLPGGPLYTADVRGFKRNRFVFGAGLVLSAERDLMVRLEYRGLFGDSEQRDNGLMLNIEKKY